MFKAIRDSLPLWPFREGQTNGFAIPKDPGILSNSKITEIAFAGTAITFICISAT